MSKGAGGPGGGSASMHLERHSAACSCSNSPPKHPMTSARRAGCMANARKQSGSKLAAGAAAGAAAAHLISSVSSSKSRAAWEGLAGAPLVLEIFTSSAAARASTATLCSAERGIDTVTPTVAWGGPCRRIVPQQSIGHPPWALMGLRNHRGAEQSPWPPAPCWPRTRAP